MSPDVLVVVAERRLRAPLQAQLLEEGCDVLAVSSWDEAELLLRKRAVMPGATIVDLDGESNPGALVPTLARLVNTATAIVLTSATAMTADEVRAHGIAHVLARPFTIGHVIERVRATIGTRPPPPD